MEQRMRVGDGNRNETQEGEAHRLEKLSELVGRTKIRNKSPKVRYGHAAGVCLAFISVQTS